MEIRMSLRSMDSDGVPYEDVDMETYFIFVARDATTGKAANIKQKKPGNEMEKYLFAAGALRAQGNKRLRLLQGTGSGGLPVNLQRQKQQMLKEGANMSLLPALQQNNKIAMADTRLENTMVCQVSLAETPGRVRGHPGGV